MDYKPKNREWVKNAAIVFLVVLLILTFFSNTIRNRTLPEVATKYVESGSITAKVRGSGTVSANGIHNVKADQTREIRAVMVKVGQQVEAGDVLFVLGAGDSAELEQAQDTLRQLQVSYQKSAISIPSYDYTLENERLERAKKSYEDAKKKYEAAEEELGKHVDASPEEIEQARKNRDQARETYDEVRDTWDKIKLDAQKNYVDAQNRLNELLAQNGGAIEGLKKADAPDKSKIQLVVSNAAVSTSADEAPSAEGTAEGGETTPTPAPVTVFKLTNMSTDLKYSINGGQWRFVKENVNELVLEGFTPSESNEIRIVRKGDGVNTGDSDILLIKFDSTGQNPVSSIEPSEAKTESAEVTAARKALADAKIKLETTEKDYEFNVSSAKGNLDMCQERLDSLLAYGGPVKDAYEKAQQDLYAAEDNYKTMKYELEQKKLSDSKNSQLAYIDLSDIATQMEKQKQIIKELSGGEENTITANVPGTVQTVDCTAGDTKLKDDLLCSIEVPDMGYTLSFSVTNDQARRLRPGDSATVSNYYWGSQIIATLNSIKVDPKNPQSNKILTFDLEGDVNAGSELTLSVGQKSANYDVIIPNSSIRTDTNGSFVLKIEAKNSPLGNRYIARRVSVEVLAADDINSAVTGDLSYGDYVITTSNAPVKAGDQVRMSES